MSMSQSSTTTAGAPHVAVLTWDQPTVADRRAHAIAEFVGADVAFVPLVAVIASAGARRACAIVDAETLARAAASLPDGSSGLALTTAPCP